MRISSVSFWVNYQFYSKYSTGIYWDTWFNAKSPGESAGKLIHFQTNKNGNGMSKQLVDPIWQKSALDVYRFWSKIGSISAYHRRGPICHFCNCIFVIGTFRGGQGIQQHELEFWAGKIFIADTNQQMRTNIIKNLSGAYLTLKYVKIERLSKLKIKILRNLHCWKNSFQI